MIDLGSGLENKRERRGRLVLTMVDIVLTIDYSSLIFFFKTVTTEYLPAHISNPRSSQQSKALMAKFSQQKQARVARVPGGSPSMDWFQGFLSEKQ